MTPLLPVCVSLHVPVARIADMPPRIPMHATSKMNRERNLPPPNEKNTKKKKNKKYQKRKFDARTTPDTCRLFKTSQKMVRRVPTPVRPQRSRKLRLTKTPARRLDAAARYHEVLSLATLHNFSSLEVIPFRFLFTTLESSYYYSCFIIYFDTQRNTRGVQKFDFEASKRGKEILLCAIVRSIILNIWFVKKSYLKVFFESSRGSYSVACRLAACLLFLYFFFAFWRLSLFFFFLLFFLLLNTFSFWMPDLIVCDWVANFDFFFFLEYDSELIRDATKLLYIYSFEMKFVVTNSRWLFKCGLITLQNDTEDQKFVKILEINPWFCSSCRVKCQ